MAFRVRIRIPKDRESTRIQAKGSRARERRKVWMQVDKELVFKNPFLTLLCVPESSFVVLGQQLPLHGQ